MIRVTRSFVLPLAFAAGALAAGTSSAQEPSTFEDPAPPRVATLESVEPPEAAEHDGHRFVAPPRPLAADAVVEDWPAFLGPRRDGVSLETNLLKDWPEGGPRLVWSVERGEGWAAPVVVDGRVVYTHRRGQSAVIDCYAAETGKLFWRVEYPCEYRGRYVSNSGPRGSPCVDGDRVYVHGVEGVLHCLELATGRVLWKRDLVAEFELRDGFFGVVSSPLIVGDKLVVNLGAPGGPSVAAFDKLDGKLVWGAGTKWGASCASPTLGTLGGRERLFVIAGGESRPPKGGLMVVDPRTGMLEFEYPFRSRTFESVVGATPLVCGDTGVLLTAGYNTGSAMIGAVGTGAADGVPRFEERWKRRRFGLEFQTPVYRDGFVYAVRGVRDRAGGVVCLDASTGEEAVQVDLVWDEEVTLANGAKRTLPCSVGNGCMIWADGAFLCLGDWGHLLWLDCSPKGVEVLARARLFGANESWTPPVVSRGLVYVCQNNRERFGDAGRRLLCFDLRAGGD